LAAQWLFYNTRNPKCFHIQPDVNRIGGVMVHVLGSCADEKPDISAKHNIWEFGHSGIT
jgi:hypothetical protein